MELRRGCREVLQRAAQERVPTHVVSVNWSSTLLRAALLPPSEAGHQQQLSGAAPQPPPQQPPPAAAGSSGQPDSGGRPDGGVAPAGVTAARAFAEKPERFADSDEEASSVAAAAAASMAATRGQQGPSGSGEAAAPAGEDVAVLVSAAAFQAKQLAAGGRAGSAEALEGAVATIGDGLVLALPSPCFPAESLGWCVSRGRKQPHLQQRPNGATSVLYILPKLVVMQITIHANDLEMGPNGHATGDIVRCGLCEP